MARRRQLGAAIVAASLLLTGAIYKRWSDSLAWGVCRTAGWGLSWRSLGFPPVRADTLRIEGWGTLREISAVYLVGGERYYIGCTMTWNQRMGWVPHELLTSGPESHIAEAAAEADGAP